MKVMNIFKKKKIRLNILYLTKSEIDTDKKIHWLEYLIDYGKLFQLFWIYYELEFS